MIRIFNHFSETIMSQLGTNFYSLGYFSAGVHVIL